MDDNIINMDELPIDEQIESLKKFIMPQPIKIDGALELKREVENYLSKWREVTKDGLELRSRQVNDVKLIFQGSIEDPEHNRHISSQDIDLLKNYITVFQILYERIENRLKKYTNLPGQPKKPAKSKPEPVTYKWTNTKQQERQLPELYRRLVDGGFIAPETSPETFTACFTGQPVQNIPEKIKWLKSKALLAYFIEGIRDEVMFTDWWHIAQYCFDKGSDLSNTRNQYLNTKTGKPKNYQLIDEVLYKL